MSGTKATKRKSTTAELRVENEKKDELKLTESTDEHLDKPKTNRFGPVPKFSYQRVWSRATIVVGVLIYVWYTSDKKETVLAKHKEIVHNRGQQFNCDSRYLKEIQQFPGCIPKKCGRYVSDKIVTANEAEVLLRIAKKGIALGGSSGGASILDLHSGALSYGDKFINVYSLEGSKKIFNSADLAIYKIVKSKIQHAIAEIFGIDANILYLTHPTFFSMLTNLDPITEHDEYWHIHVDKDNYESFHYTSLLYLSDYNIEFEGGRLIFSEGGLNNPSRNVTLEPRKGRVAMFTSGAENPHFVERVSSGIRYAITVSFTCDRYKSINDPNVH